MTIPIDADSGGFELTVLAAPRAEQQAAADAWLARSSGSRAIVVEGPIVPLPVPPGVASVALGAGCPCCSGFVALRVALARVLREHRPDQTLVLVAAPCHVDQVAERLAAFPFGAPLKIHVGPTAEAMER